LNHSDPFVGDPGLAGDIEGVLDVQDLRGAVAN
jgi:hypothetical protein